MTVGGDIVSLGGRVEFASVEVFDAGWGKVEFRRRPFAEPGKRLVFAGVGAKDGWAKTELAPGVRRAPVTFGVWEGEG